MTYTYIVDPSTGEILFDLFHDLITQNIRAIKLIAKKLNAGAPLEKRDLWRISRNTLEIELRAEKKNSKMKLLFIFKQTRLKS